LEEVELAKSRGILRVAVWGLLIVASYGAIRVAFYAHEVRRQSEIAAISTLKVQYVLDPTDSRWRAQPFAGDFDVTSSSTVVVRNGEHLYEIRTPFGEGVFSAVPVKGPAPDSFAVDNDDVLLTVAGGYFGMLGPEGEPVDAVPLPDQQMRLAHSMLNGVIYLYGGSGADYRLYSFAENGAFRILAQLDEPITAVADNQKSVYIATANSLFRLRDSHVSLLFKIPEGEIESPIVSVAAAPGDDLLFFSTRTKVYALRGAAALSIVNNSGGGLRLRGETLYVLDGTRGLVYTLSPATRGLFGEEHS
jgi:hypothetical protein